MVCWFYSLVKMVFCDFEVDLLLDVRAFHFLLLLICMFGGLVEQFEYILGGFVSY